MDTIFNAHCDIYRSCLQFWFPATELLGWACVLFLSHLIVYGFHNARAGSQTRRQCGQGCFKMQLRAVMMWKRGGKRIICKVWTNSTKLLCVNPTRRLTSDSLMRVNDFPGSILNFAILTTTFTAWWLMNTPSLWLTIQVRQSFWIYVLSFKSFDNDGLSDGGSSTIFIAV